MTRRGSTLRWGALLGLCALVLHELQYRVSFGEGAGRALAASGHGYLSWALALVTVIAAVAAIRLVAEVGGARGGAPPPPRPRASLWRWWGCSSGALAAVFVLQEALEGALGGAHPGVFHAVAGHHGWIALLAAVALGLLVASLMRGAEAIVARAARPARPRRRPHPPEPRLRPFVRLRITRLELLAEHLAGRAPPTVCS